MKIKLGLHFSAYESVEYLDKFILPWLEYKKNNDLIISAGHVCFKEFQEMECPVESKDGTHLKLEEYYKNKIIDHYQFITDPLIESEARTRILEPLLQQDINILWITAPDEIYTISEIENALKYIQKDPFIQWYRIEHKNLTFTDRQYIRGFNPPRIFLNNKCKIKYFRADDEVVYEKDGKLIDYLQLPNKQIPFSICSPLHYSWLNNERSRDKSLYQQRRWGGKAGCSFDWDDKENKLVFSSEFYKKRGLPFPDLFPV